MWEHWKWSQEESEKVIKSAKWEKLKVDQLWAKRNIRSAICNVLAENYLLK